MHRDSNHPIIERPWEYEIISFCYERARTYPHESRIDMVLVRGDEIRRLRFIEPRSISIEEGFPIATGGMQILDISARQLAELTVEVSDFEASNGAVKFFARAVVDLDVKGDQD